ncbi:MAG: FecR domain-containing protein [Rhodobacteraceae bacterium]|nr:FecR domain-containing protein [Paracoccaceae bacterium]
MSVQTFNYPRRTAILGFAAGMSLPRTALGQGTEAIGQVERVQGEARAERAGGNASLQGGHPVFADDLVQTGPLSRLSLIFADQSHLTLGENAEVLIDEFVYRGNRENDVVALAWTSGAFLSVSGAIARARAEAVSVRTPVATIGIRGTEFWGGRLERDFEVLVIEGRVVVANAGGSVELSPGETTAVIDGATAPAAAAIMPADRRTRAFATVTFAP